MNAHVTIKSWIILSTLLKKNLNIWIKVSWNKLLTFVSLELLLNTWATDVTHRCVSMGALSWEKPFDLNCKTALFLSTESPSGCKGATRKLWFVQPLRRGGAYLSQLMAEPTYKTTIHTCDQFKSNQFIYLANQCLWTVAGSQGTQTAPTLTQKTWQTPSREAPED